MTSSQVSAGLSRELPCAPPRRTWVEFLVVFIGASARLCPSSESRPSSVDRGGSGLRHIPRPRLQFRSSSHMSVPSLGTGMDSRSVKAGDRPSRSEAVGSCWFEVMNPALAAGCCALLFALVRSLTDSLKLDLLATLAWSLSHAVLLHATNAAEPMSGLFFSACAFAIVIVSVRRGLLRSNDPGGISACVGYGKLSVHGLHGSVVWTRRAAVACE